MKIHRLKETIINRIAAGEVVERPASVVKELVENAIDAGADRIEIATAGGGKNLIRVSDNGGGIAADQLELAVSRHCTSKMQEDIHDIRALGFRGEALPSIASVAHLRLTSRPKNSDAGAEILVAGGETGEVRPAAAQYGTVVEVKDLFYATPARLKFLKSDRAEATAINDVVKRIAIAFPHIRFTLSGPDRVITDLPAAPLFATPNSTTEQGKLDTADQNESTENETEDNALYKADKAKAEAYHGRLTKILGKDFIDNSVLLSARRQDVHIFGFVSIPSFNRGNSLHQFIYVNGRPVRDKGLTGALRAAYADMLPHGRHAVATLFIELDPSMVDVNVHPAKADVRFRDAGLIRGLIIGSIRQVLEQAGARPATTAAAAFIRTAEANRQARSQNAANPNSNTSYQTGSNSPYARFQNTQGSSSALTQARSPYMTNGRHAQTTSFNEDSASITQNEESYNNLNLSADFNSYNAQSHNNGGDIPPEMQQQAWSEMISPSADFRPLADNNATANPDIKPDAGQQQDETYPLGAARAQIHKNYIIAQTEASLVIVDQHAAHERLVYEALKEALYAKPLNAQMLLIPEIIELPPEDIARLLPHAETLQKFGLIIESFGTEALAVRGTPAMLGEIDTQSLIKDLADEIAEHDSVRGLKSMLDYVAATMACHGSVRSGRLLKPEEMNALLRQMEQVPESGTCNHGRPTFIELKLSDIEKLFARR